MVLYSKMNILEEKQMNYQNRVLNLLNEISYIIYYVRQKGMYDATQNIELDDFDLEVKPIITHSFKLLSIGMDERQIKMFLELKKIELFEDPSLSTSDYKLVQIYLDLIGFIQYGNLNEFSTLSKEILEIEGNREDITIFSELINYLVNLENKKILISKLEFNQYIQKIPKIPSVELLTKDEIDNILKKILKIRKNSRD